METYKNLKKGTKIGLIISMVFIIFGIVLSVYNIVAAGRIPALPGEGMDLGANPAPAAPPVVRNCIDLVLLLAVTFYAVIGHKKPHGNMLKIVSVVFGAYLAFLSVLELNAPISISYISCGCYLVAALTVTYVAGRLHKIEKNRILLCLAGVCLLASAISSVIIFANAPHLPDSDSAFVRIVAPVCGLTPPLFIHAALGFAYTARYEEHKAAGLEDK